MGSDAGFFPFLIFIIEQGDFQKSACELQLAELSAPSTAHAVTEDTLRQLLSMFQKFVIEQNIPECKKFIRSFVQKVVVYHTRVEVILRVSMTPDDGGAVTLSSEGDIREIKEKYKIA